MSKKKRPQRDNRGEMPARRLQKPKPSERPQKPKTLATVDFNNREELNAVLGEDIRKAGQRIHVAVKKLQDAGIIDAAGNRINKKLPPAMLQCLPPE